MKSAVVPGTKAYEWQLIHLAKTMPLASVDNLDRLVRKSRSRTLTITMPQYIADAMFKAGHEYRMDPDTETKVEEDIVLMAIERFLVERGQLTEEDKIGGWGKQ